MRITPFIPLLLLSACTSGTASAPDVTGLLLLGVLLGAVIAFLAIRAFRKKEANPRAVESSHTVIEGMRRVFKIVFAEGHFNELYTFEETKKLFGVLPTTRRALVIIQAKVMVGYDFSKCIWETDEATRTIKLVQFPQPEIISIEPDYKYYNFDENIFNMMGREDLTRIQANGKKQVEQAAIKSHLPKIAADQMRMLLAEVVHSKQWNLQNVEKIAALPPSAVEELTVDS